MKHVKGTYWYVKRILDIIFSFILIIITLPLMLVVAICVLIGLGLPLYNQKRYREGLNKKTYLMFKFRTKLLNCDNLPLEKRYTKFSAALDASRLNELPQLFNILKGDMSFVGPRPFIPGEPLPGGKVSEKRYLVRPGLTGLAFINGGVFLSHEAKLKYDEIYYDNFGFKQDLIIVLKTPIELIRQSRRDRW